MSGHIKCTCGRKRGDHSDLVVTERKCGYDLRANRYGMTESSRVHCTRPGCYGSWRTKAKYVDSLPDEVRD
jgi:hypothetical protein